MINNTKKSSYFVTFLLMKLQLPKYLLYVLLLLNKQKHKRPPRGKLQSSPVDSVKDCLDQFILLNEIQL